MLRKHQMTLCVKCYIAFYCNKFEGHCSNVRTVPGQKLSYDHLFCENGKKISWHNNYEDIGDWLLLCQIIFEKTRIFPSGTLLSGSGYFRWGFQNILLGPGSKHKLWMFWIDSERLCGKGTYPEVFLYISIRDETQIHKQVLLGIMNSEKLLLSYL